MIKYMVIGDPVGHSRSPGMQNAAFEYYRLGSPYGIRHVRPDELPEFIEFARENLDGVNLTVPHKQAVIGLIDEVEPAARRAGSVNTLCIRAGRIHGAGTDGYGLEHALRENFNRPVAGAKFCFIGAGGAAHATMFHLAAAGADTIRIANRTVTKADELAGKLRSFHPSLTVETARPDDDATLDGWLDDTDFLIQATSLGLKASDPAPIAPELLRGGRKFCFFDTIYQNTPLLECARSAGLPAADGELMLIYQGAKSFELWTGLAAPIAAMRRGFREAQSC